jgi:hypothetical protein
LASDSEADARDVELAALSGENLVDLLGLLSLEDAYASSLNLIL